MDPSNPTERFTGLSDPYAKGRPGYPTEIIQWCLALTPAPPELIVDVGCGTGISTRVFAESGHRVIGIDPNADMLASATAKGGATYQYGTSTATGLPDACADLIVSAQAFHWFELPATLQELRRIGRASAWCAAFWNIRRVDVPFMADYEALLQRTSTEYEVNDRAPRTIAHMKELIGSSAIEHTVQHAVRMNGERLRALALSSSYVKHGVADIPAFLMALDALFARHAGNSEVEMRYSTRAIAWPAQAAILRR